MALPRQSEIEVPLLRALMQLDGESRARDVYPLVTKQFPEVTEAETAERMQDGGNKWTNRIQWARQPLIDKGELESGGWGIWRITVQGRARLEAAAEGLVTSTPVVTNLQAIWEDYEESFREKTLERLQALTPEQFERFGREFLRAYGFVKLEVTKVGPDGGIDGDGELRVGLATMRVAFQCKRWKGKVPRPEIDKFRGATQGAYEQGIFFTTSDFTADAKGASIKRGAIPIVLLNGEELVEVMLAKNFGVAKRPLFLFEEVPIAGVDDEL